MEPIPIRNLSLYSDFEKGTNMAVSWIVAIIVLIFLLAFLIAGAYRGFLRILLTTFSLVITLILAGALSKPLADFVENKTAIGPRVEHRIEEYVSSSLGGISGTVEAAENEFINALPLPSSMKADLSARNTLAGYADEGVSSFSEYLGKQLSSLVLRVLSYVLLFLVIFLILRLILRLSNLVNHIPILGGINRFFGAILGLVEGTLFLWVICFAIMMLAGTDFGATCEKVIRENAVLSFIYDHNYLSNAINGILGIFR